MKNNIRKLAVLAIVAMLLTLVPLASVAETQMTVTGDFVNFRDSYAGGGKILACLRQGAVVKQLSSQTYNGGWYHVEYNGQKGYIWGQYLKVKSNSSSGKTTTANNNTTTTTAKTTAAKTTTAKGTTAKSTTTANQAIRRNNDTVRATITKSTSVYASASSRAKVVTTLKTRTTVSVLSRKNNYVYITTSKMSGYVPANSITLNNTKAVSAKVKKVTNGNYKVYTGSTGSGQTVATVKANANITVLHQGTTWSYVKVGNVYGYISKQVYEVSKNNT